MRWGMESKREGHRRGKARCRSTGPRPGNYTGCSLAQRRPAESDIIVDSILDWMEPGDLHRLNGAKTDDYYKTSPAVPLQEWSA